MMAWLLSLAGSWTRTRPSALLTTPHFNPLLISAGFTELWKLSRFPGSLLSRRLLCLFFKMYLNFWDLILYVWVFCLDICLCAICIQCPERPKEAIIRYLGTGVIQLWVTWHACGYRYVSCIHAAIYAHAYKDTSPGSPEGKTHYVLWRGKV